jgi:hypothetical protein
MLLTYRWSTVRAGTVDGAVPPRIAEFSAMAPAFVTGSARYIEPLADERRAGALDDRVRRY